MKKININYMIKYFKNYPTPIAGFTLGLSGFSFTMAIYLSMSLIYAIGALVAFLLLIPLVIKFLNNKHLSLDLNDSTISGVLPTFSMTLMIIANAVYVFINQELGLTLWFIAIGIHVILFLVFIFFRFKNFSMEHIVPTWFVPPIGIVVAAVFIPEFNFYTILTSEIIVWFGIIMYVIMLPIMLYRLVLLNTPNYKSLPSLAILAAPGSLNIVGYMAIFNNNYDSLLILPLFGVALFMTLTVYVKLIYLLKIKFSPGFSAYTFPLAISATAAIKVYNWSVVNFPNEEIAINILGTIKYIEICFTTLIIAYVAIRYIGLTYISLNKKQTTM